MSRFRNLVAGAALGALAMYFLDPVSGRARRVRLRDRSTARSRHLARRMERGSVHLEHDALGLAQRLAHLSPEPPADDLTLLDRILSEIYTDPAMPKGKFSVDVVRGVTVLRGELPNQAVVDRVTAAVAAVDGVTAIKSLLHVPGTPAPNKLEAIQAAR